MAELVDALVLEARGRNTVFKSWYNTVKEYLDKEEKDNTISVELSKEDEDIITRRNQISRILMNCSDDETIADISFGSRVLQYPIKIEFDKEEGDSIPSSEYLRESNYILISILFK